ncbi:O-linked N-acetylglucosamine transferase, SPINDLY family protein [Kamptonema formosum]|uniref:O-linked N-acetylglucosamine transferase, SPINDLY family protein n=1 Tax=Kamptonema formosum TaxID=331992 RepID=UPI0003479CB0|nr:tetratricopeptide repeat protein [Oscillatoria sp. PCC 10802]
MTSGSSATIYANWLKEANQYFIQGDYSKAISLYEQAIEAEPDVKSHYWHLGLLLLLQGQEAEAHTTWLLGMVDGEAEEVEEWTGELVQVLQTEAQRREALEDNSVAWLIRGHIRELQPADINNLLYLIELAIKLERFTADELDAWKLIELLQAEEPASADADLLLQVLKNVLKCAPLHPSSLEFAEACLPYVHQHRDFYNVMLYAAVEVGHSLGRHTIAASIVELCLRVDANHTETLRHLATFSQNAADYAKGIEMAKRCYSLVETLPEKVFANHLIIRGLLGAVGYWEDACSALQLQESLLLELVAQEPAELPQPTVSRMLTSVYFFPYFRDQPQQNRLIQNQVARLCQSYYISYAREGVESYYQRHVNRKNKETGSRTKPLKIGYISHCLKSHSVGWLARWIFQDHDRERFQVHAYLVGYGETGDPLQEWYVNQVYKAHKLGADNQQIAEQIYQDEIDILIDLDSLTLDITCEVMALKPAPVQVTWLGWDASGLPAIDYYIADPYVLPESAQDYYTEKIWRLPQTYIAVNGFEVGVPTLRREQLDIPTDAVVYYSGQGGYKRHRDTARLQMKILKEVPNSYFLIKGKADQESITSFFIQLAEEEGVDGERLRFLPSDPSEAIHRANLGIADVVLDTYPYNGATTTLETLWMGVPLVTRVGQQFAARNSYTMMVNAGVTEGIAWTDEEYVEWGIRLGKDPVLRQQISWRLRQSRQTSPLWNAKQFTREMENAYEQMWAIYMEGGQ